MTDLTPCCGAYSTWGDGGLYCKKCFEPVNPVDVFAPPKAEDALSFDEVEAAGLDGTLRTVGAADQTCEPGRHLGPVVPTGDHEIIDDGVAFWFRCETCGQTGDGCIDVSEINLEGDRA